MPVFVIILTIFHSKYHNILASVKKSIYPIRVKKKANPQSIVYTTRRESSKQAQPNMQTSKARTLLKATLQTDVQFKESMRVYLQKTKGVLPRYKNRLQFDFNEEMWNLVDKMRQCSSCGQILVSMNRDVKLMSCGVCKSAYYCNRECQKRDWKLYHKPVCSATPIVKNLKVSNLCVRILSIMSILATSEGTAPVCEMMGKPDILNSMFSFEKKDAILHGDDAFVAQVQINHDDNPVCNHFRQRQESNRILFPIWDTCTDNMVFVPVSFDFMTGGCIPGSSGNIVDAHICKNFKTYSICARYVGDDKRFLLPVHTFVQVCTIDWEL